MLSLLLSLESALIKLHAFYRKEEVMELSDLGTILVVFDAI